MKYEVIHLKFFEIYYLTLQKRITLKNAAEFSEIGVYYNNNFMFLHDEIIN